LEWVIERLLYSNYKNFQTCRGVPLSDHMWYLALDI
jgi:hypothetical protein